MIKGLQGLSAALCVCVALGTATFARGEDDAKKAVDKANDATDELYRFSNTDFGQCSLADVSKEEISAFDDVCKLGGGWAKPASLKQRNEEMKKFCSSDSAKAVGDFNNNVNDKFAAASAELAAAEKKAALKLATDLAASPNFDRARDAFSDDPKNAASHMEEFRSDNFFSLDSMSTCESKIRRAEAIVIGGGTTRDIANGTYSECYTPPKSTSICATTTCPRSERIVIDTCERYDKVEIYPDSEASDFDTGAVRKRDTERAARQKKACLAEQKVAQQKNDACARKAVAACEKTRKDEEALASQNSAECNKKRQLEEQAKLDAAAKKRENEREAAVLAKIAKCNTDRVKERNEILAKGPEDKDGTDRKQAKDYAKILSTSAFMKSVYNMVLQDPDKLKKCVERTQAEDICARLAASESGFQKKAAAIYTPDRMARLNKLGDKLKVAYRKFIDSSSMSKADKANALARLKGIQFSMPHDEKQLNHIYGHMATCQCHGVTPGPNQKPARNGDLEKGEECATHPIMVGPPFMMMLDQGEIGEERLLATIAHEMAHGITLRQKRPFFDPVFNKAAECLGEHENRSKFKDVAVDSFNMESVADLVAAKATAEYLKTEPDLEKRKATYLRGLQGTLCPMYANHQRSATEKRICRGDDEGNISYPEWKMKDADGNLQHITSSNCAAMPCTNTAPDGAVTDISCCDVYKERCVPSMSHPIIPDRTSLFLVDPDLKKAVGCKMKDKKVMEATKGACKL